MKILAFDQALRQSGWCLFENNQPIKWGLVNPKPKSADIQTALVSIKRQFRQIIRSEKPDMAILEIPMGGDEADVANHRTAFILAQVYGVILELLGEENIPTDEIYAATWQNVIGIHKRERSARKTGAVNYVNKKYKINVAQDIIDAICIGDAWLELHKEERSAF